MQNMILNPQPISNRFLYRQTINPKKLEMELYYNNKLGCISIKKPFPISDLRPRFAWITCYEPEDHLDELVNTISNLPNINKNSIIGAFSFKDDTTLNRFNKASFFNTWRIDPKLDLYINQEFFSIETLQDCFNKKNCQTILFNHKKADVFIARHVIEHSYNIVDFVKNSSKLVNDNGYIVFELPDCERAMLAGDCTIIWEEHINYFTEASFEEFLKSFNLEIVFWKNYKYQLENSLTVILKKIFPKVTKNKRLINSKKQKKLFEIFKRKVFKRKSIIRAALLNFKKNVGSIALLGAGHLTSTFLTINDIDDIIEFIIDDNNYKNNMYMPSGKLKIKNSDYLRFPEVKMCLLGANPQNHEIIIKKHKKFSNDGGIFRSIFPGTKGDLGGIYDKVY